MFVFKDLVIDVGDMIFRKVFTQEEYYLVTDVLDRCGPGKTAVHVRIFDLKRKRFDSFAWESPEFAAKLFLPCEEKAAVLTVFHCDPG